MAHILVMEDDAQFRQMLVQMLQQDGHHVDATADGAEGMNLLRQTNPDLIVTDILMPNMDGVEAMLALSQEQRNIPIIAISGGRRSISSSFNLESAALLGARETLAKPFSRNDLRNAIERVLK